MPAVVRHSKVFQPPGILAPNGSYSLTHVNGAITVGDNHLLSRAVREMHRSVLSLYTWESSTCEVMMLYVLQLRSSQPAKEKYKVDQS